ncbi:MAG: Nucleoside triphosphate pyrophosphohydrolase [Candidatus Anoxychlamydiales bacterium]|nr:Nucleoside triphosphate pyrophosphohydrolase [Candidatus Anoxychlamydiales bacterium]
MNKFNSLLNIADILLGPKGCEWDKKQSFESLKKYFIEEVYELVDAIDLKDDINILEELGDVLYLVIFLTKLAETKNKFNMDGVIQNISDKLIRRHPHVFADVKVESVDDIVKNWEKIKKEEKADKSSKDLVHSFPKSMPIFSKMQKIIRILKNKNLIEKPKIKLNEKEIQDQLVNLIIHAQMSDIDIDKILKDKLKNLLESEKITGDDLEA